MTRPYDSRSWRALRKRVLVRDGWTCRMCGRHADELPRGKTSLTAAHIVPARAGGRDSMDNLVTLCAECHGRQDGGRRY